VITAREIEELKGRLARITHGAWVVAYNASKEPRIESSVGVVVVPYSYTMTKEDAEAIAAMHEALPKLLAALESKERERLDAVHAYERAHDAHIETMRKTLVEAGKTTQAINDALSRANELVDRANRAERELAALRAEVDRQRPLVDAVAAWGRNRHSPRLLAALDLYMALSGQ
jgi:SMC interacting uncharacterized protein involved in chromosome segregation